MKSNLITTDAFMLLPTDYTQLRHYAELLSHSTIVPLAFQHKPADIIVAIQMGAEVGLQPLQALKNIAVINGTPSIWGDAMLALVQASSKFEWIQETFDVSTKTATCTVKRKGSPEHTVTFSMEDARQAGLLDKRGTAWKQYPKRMCALRARGFALRNQFADVLMGLALAEEVIDYKNTRSIKIDLSEADISDIASAPVEEDHMGFEIMINDDQIQTLERLIAETELTKVIVKKVLKAAGVKNISQLPFEKAQKWIDHLRNKKQEQLEKEENLSAYEDISEEVMSDAA